MYFRGGPWPTLEFVGKFETFDNPILCDFGWILKIETGLDIPLLTYLSVIKKLSKVNVRKPDMYEIRKNGISDFNAKPEHSCKMVQSFVQTSDK